MNYINKAKVILSKGDFYILSDLNYCYIIECSDELHSEDIIAWDETGTFFYNVTENYEVYATMQYEAISRQSALECLNKYR